MSKISRGSPAPGKRAKGVPALQRHATRHHCRQLGFTPEGRQLHLNPSFNPLIGNMIIKLAADHLPEGGEVALLSATTTSTNQSIWMEEMTK